MQLAHALCQDVPFLCNKWRAPAAQILWSLPPAQLLQWFIESIRKALNSSYLFPLEALIIQGACYPQMVLSQLVPWPYTLPITSHKTPLPAIPTPQGHLSFTGTASKIGSRHLPSLLDLFHLVLHLPPPSVGGRDLWYIFLSKLGVVCAIIWFFRA